MRKPTIYLLIILATVFLLNIKSWDAYFSGDDFTILHTVSQKGPSFFLKLFYKDSNRDIWPGWKQQYDANHLGFIRPMLFTYFKLTYLLFETHPLGYHLSNVFFHFLNCWLVFLIIRFITRDPVMGFIGGMLMAVHPIQAPIVVWFSGCASIIATLLYLTSFYFYMKYRSERSTIYIFLSFLLFFVGLFFKESLAILPVHLLCYDLLRDHLWTAGAEPKPLLSVRRIKESLVLVPYGVVLACYFIIRKLAFGSFIGGYGGHAGLRVRALFLIDYIRFCLLAAPWDVDRQMVAFNPMTYGVRFGAAEIIIGIFLLCFIFLPLIFHDVKKIKHLNLLTFGLLWVTICYFIVLPIKVNVAPQYITPLIVGVICTIVALTFSFYRKELALLISAGLIIVYGAYQFKYNGHWVHGTHIAKTIKETVEVESAHFNKGDTIVLIDIPSSYKTAHFFFGNLARAFQPPFTATDIFNNFNMKVFSPLELKVTLERYLGSTDASIDEIKNVLRVAPMIHSWIFDNLNLLKPPTPPQEGIPPEVHLFKWNRRTERLELVSDAASILAD